MWAYLSAFCVFVGVVSVGCRRPGGADSEVPAPVKQGVADAPGATWVYHPLKKSETTDTVEFDGGLVEVDLAGSRWWHEKGKAPEVSPFGAPEALSAVLTHGKQLAAVGESGAVYLADGALAPFVEVRTPKERYVMTTRSGNVLLAVSQSGAIHRTENLGRHWSLARDDHYFVELAASSDGTLLSYSVPEQWHKSTDHGQSFSLLKVPSQAPRRLWRSAAGEIFVEGLYHTSVFRGDALEPMAGQRTTDAEQLTNAGDEKQKRREYSLPSFPKASWVAARRATLEGSRYLGLKSGAPGKPWKLLSGGLDTPNRNLEVTGLQDCGAFVFTSSGARSAVLCQQTPTEEVAPRVRIYRSTLNSAEYGAVPKMFRGKLGGLKVALSASGRLAISGLCLNAELGCSPSGAAVLDAAGRLTHEHVPGVEVADALGFDEAGTLWLAGRREKDGHIVAFRASKQKGPGLLIDLTRQASFPKLISKDAKFDLDVLPGEKGLLTLSLMVTGSAHVATLDGGGQLIAFGTTPAGVHAVHGAGARLAALQEGESVLWESTSAGLAWTPAPLPRRICAGSPTDCKPDLVCSQAGCLVGDELVRLGWGNHQGDAPPTLPHDSAADLPGQTLLGFDCDAGQGAWAPLDGLMAVPEALDAALGDTAWRQALQVSERAELTAISARFGESEIHREVLFGPVTNAKEYALHVVPQVEGVAGVRYRVPQRQPGRATVNQSSRHPIEVAWDNRITGVYGSAVIDHPMESVWPFSIPTILRARSLELVSVAGSGLYLRLKSPGPTYFVTGQGKQARVEEMRDIKWPQGSQSSRGWIDELSLQDAMSYERLRVDGQHAGLLMLADRNVLSLTESLSPSGDATAFHPYLMGMLSRDSVDYAQGVHISYLGQHVGFVSMQVNPGGPGHRAAFVQLRAERGFAPPVPVPLQPDLGQSFAPCSKAERRETPRVVAPPAPGAARRIAVSGVESEPLELLTERAVLHGTTKKPCVAAFDGQNDARGTGEGKRYAVLVFPEGPSWLFRITQDPVKSVVAEARPMSCRLEGSPAD